MCNCDCESPDYDDELGEELYDQNEVVAELVFFCCECNQPISTGAKLALRVLPGGRLCEKYRQIIGCWDGDWSTYRMCLSCSRVSDAFSQEVDACHCFGGLYEELIATETLSTLKGDDGRTIKDDLGNCIWLTESPWLRVISQRPLKCEVIELEPKP